MRVELGRHGGSKNHSGWRLYTGSGHRTTDYAIAFRRPFRIPPKVHVGLSGEDVIDGANHRLVVQVVGVGREGFVLRYHTWSNTRVWSAGVNWIAFGAGAAGLAEDALEGELAEEIDFAQLGEGVLRESDPEPEPSD